MICRYFSVAAAAIFLMLAKNQIALAEDQFSVSRKLPDEYESSGGHSLSLGDAGIAAAGGVSSARLNPAMLPLEKVYQVNGGYHWPTEGREFYQVGIVDSKTAKIAAAVNFTGFADEYNSAETIGQNDTPVERRIVIGLGQEFRQMSVGINGQWVEGVNVEGRGDSPTVKGTTFGAGIATLITPQLRLGVSAENLANGKVKAFAPRTIRAGLGYVMFAGKVTAHLDWRQRDRIPYFEAPRPTDAILGLNSSAEDADYDKSPEQMGIASFSAKVQDYFRLLGAYGRQLNGERQTLSGGVAIVSDPVSFVYSASRPYLDNETAHQAISVAVGISL